MARELTKGESKLKQEELCRRLMDDDFVAKKVHDQALELDISVRTLMNWLANPDIVDHKAIDKKRQAAIFRHKPKIDMAVLAKAKNGNISAAELAYKMIMGLSEKHVNEVIARTESEEMEKFRNMSIEETNAWHITQTLRNPVYPDYVYPEYVEAAVKLLKPEEQQALVKGIRMAGLLDVKAIEVASVAADTGVVG
jgi:hypothetical protein